MNDNDTKGDKTMRQKVTAQDQLTALRSIEAEKDARESNRRLSLSACECYCEGYERGAEDAKDGYRGALDRISTLGNDYAYPDSYRNGYLSWFS